MLSESTVVANITAGSGIALLTPKVMSNATLAREARD
jgi:hypothetical protein